MSGAFYIPRRLAERGVRLAIPVDDPPTWRARMERDPLLPATYPELRELVEQHVRGQDRTSALPEGVSPEEPRRPLIDTTCGEGRLTTIFRGFGNPDLATAERDTLEAILAEATPSNWRSRETEHFVLRWTEDDPEPLHNFDPALIDEAETLLELAWDRLSTAFGRPPFSPGGKIQVDFQDLPDDLQGQADPPEGPIVFDAPLWQATQALRAPLAAHELFHKFQYAYGFRDTWGQGATNLDWLSEGTARWAEVFVQQRLTDSRWLLDWMKDPNLDLFAISSFVLPFWIFFDARLTPGALPRLWASCEAELDGRGGLDRALSDVGQDLASFFALFAAAIKIEDTTGGWRRTPGGQILYPQILGLDGLPAEPRVQTEEVRLEAGESFPAPTVQLGGLAACHHAFTFAPDATGRFFRVEAHSTADLTYQVVLQGTGQALAQDVIDDFSHERAIQAGDSLLLISSSRRTRARVEVSGGVD